MSNFFFRKEPNPDARDPQEMRILDLRAEPYPDRMRFKVYLYLTPFKQPPNLEVQLISEEEGKVLARVSIIEAVNEKLTFVMHLRAPYSDPLLLRACLNYQDDETIHQYSAHIGEKND